MWTVVFLDQAAQERLKLSKSERTALVHAVEKLESVGPGLGYPHTSAVQVAAAELRELRPRAGRSPWRALYQRTGDVFVIAAIAPEAEVNRRGFTKAVRLAQKRLDEQEEN